MFIKHNFDTYFFLEYNLWIQFILHAMFTHIVREKKL